MKKNIFKIFLITIAVLLLVGSVSAATTVNANLNSPTTNIKVGDEISITLGLEVSTDNKNGINAYKATLEYDERLFEEVYQTDFTSLNNWELLKYNRANKEFVAIKKAGTRVSEAVVTLKLKVKANASASVTTIKLKDIVTSDGTKDLFIADKEITVNIIKEQTTIPTKPGESNSGNNEGNINEDDNKQPDDNKGTIESPKPGDSTNKNDYKEEPITETTKSYKILFLIILLESVFFIIIIIKKKKEDDDEHNNKDKKIMMIIVAGLVFIQFIGTVGAAIYSFYLKGEVTGDYIVDYNDVEALELHLIKSQILDKVFLENADVNSDGAITVTDLTLLVQKLEKKLDYSVTLSEIEASNLYPEKNEEITIKFMADVSYGARISRVVINNVTYKAEAVTSATGEYQVKINVGATAGVKRFEITEVILDNDKIIEVNYSEKIDVLKEIPTIQNYTTEDDPNSSKIYILFNVEDVDDSFVDGTVHIIDEDGNEIQTSEVVKEGYRIEVPVIDGKTYNVQIDIEYDLDSGVLVTGESHAGTYRVEKTIGLTIVYNFSLDGVLTKKETGEEVSTFEKNEKVIVEFNSSNSTTNEPSVAVIDGVSYSITKSNGKYIVTLDNQTAEIGSKSLNLEKVVLSNGASFDVNNRINFNVTNRKPIVTNFNSVENIDDDTLKVDFLLVDDDSTLKSMSIYLLDNDKVIDSYTFTQEEINNGALSRVLSTQVTSQYIVRIRATYNIGDDENENLHEETLFEEIIKAKARVEIDSATLSDVYFEKGGIVKITYSISTNKTEEISKIRVNNTDCIVTKISDNVYEVSYVLPTDSGIAHLNTTAFIFSDEAVADVDNVLKVDVLKDIPSIMNFKQNDNIEEGIVNITFTVSDPDASFIEGKIVLTSKVDGTTIEKPIANGFNSIDLAVQNAVEYILDIKVTYDLDSNSLENKDVEDNRFNLKTIETKSIMLLSDYELVVEDIKTYNHDGETKYFNKNEEIIIDFASSNISIYDPVEVVINGVTYDLIKNDNRYSTILEGFGTSGITALNIEEIILDNTKELGLQDTKIDIEILKDIPVVDGFVYQENDDNTVSITFDLVDFDDALINKKVVVRDEDNNILLETEINVQENTLNFTKNESEEYYVEVIATYDLDTNKTDNINLYSDKLLLEEVINVGIRQFEMKDILSITVYRSTSTGAEAVNSLRESDLADLSKYIVKVEMLDIADFYTTIEDYKIEDNQIKFILAYDNIVQYFGDQKQNKLEVTFGTIENSVAKNLSLQDIIEAITANPNGTFSLDRDYDAKDFSGTSLIDSSVIFTGTLNGNGHTIKNLNKPLFNSINGATIKNLVIDSPTLNASTSRGVIANIATNATIENVHIKDLNLTTKANMSAGMVGEATSTNFIQCSVTNFTITTAGHIRVSAIVGQLTGGTISNCYVEGTLNSTQSKDGNGIGGVLGHGFGVVTVENCIVKVAMSNNVSSRLNGGIVGLFADKNSILRNNVSLSTGSNFYSIHGNEPNSNASNNYELADSGLVSNASGNKIMQISLANINKDFYINIAKFSESIWDFSNIGDTKLPTLKNADPNYSLNATKSPTNSDIYIPDFERLSELKNYDKNYEIAYSNMFKLMPYYDAKFYVVDGNKLEVNHILNTKIIKYVFAYDENDKQIVAMGQNEAQKIKKIRILFTDNDSVTYDVTYEEDNGLITIYTINDLDIYYGFDKYLVNNNSAVYSYIVNRIKDTDYLNDISTVVEDTAVRNYTDNYASVKDNAQNFALNLMASVSDYSLTSSSLVLENKLLSDLNSDRTLDKIIFAYNYYDRFYDFEIGGINIRDIVFFDGRIFSDKFNAINMTNNVLNTTAAYRATTGANNFFTAYITPETGLSIYYFVDYFIVNLTNETYKNDSASWIIDNYQGTIYEAGTIRYDNIRYRVWDHLKARPQLIIYLLSYPGDDLYIMGLPTTIMVGNLRLYYSNYDIVSAETKLSLLQNYSINVVSWYDTVAGVVEGTTGFTNLANFSQISYDTTVGKNWSTDPDAQPVFKYFYEAINHWITSPAGAAAYANGTDMNWVAYKALSDYLTFSHESIHNQDGRVFLLGTGRRSGAGAEHFTDNFLTQSYPNSYNGTYGVVPNYTYMRPITATMTTNLTNERINTREKIESYYKGMYDAFAFLDYIEAQAFLQLAPEEQCRIAQSIENGAYVWKTAEDFKKMNLKTMEDIWDNQLVIIRGNKAYTTGSLWSIYENKAVGAASKAFFVLNAYQFLADFGYSGYVAYAGNAYGSKTDEEILRIMSGDPNMTFKSYQLGRYEKVSEQIKKYAPIDVDEAIANTLEAMKIDLQNNKPIDLNSNASIYRESLYGYLKRATNDFLYSIYDEGVNTVHVSSAAEFMEKIKDHPELNVILDQDLDFSNIPVNDETQYLIETFVGTLDGNNHKITGLTRPLFNNMVFVYVKNLTIENSNVISNYNTAGVLGKTMDFSLIENVTLKNVNMSGTNTVGSLVGKINRTTVSNVKYEVTVSSLNNSNTIGGLFGIATYSTITNVHGINSTVSGTGTVGGIVGNGNYIFELSESSFNGTVSNQGNVTGGLVGVLQNSIIKNSYALGAVNGNAYNGGIVGNVATSNINNNFSAATVTGTTMASTGGLFGNIASGNYTNNLSLGRVNNGYKIYGNATKAIVEAGFVNNYELVESIGHSTLEKTDVDFVNRISTINLSGLNNNFYINTLKFDNNVWDFANVSNGGLPKLKNSDPNSVGTIIEKKEIKTIDDFLGLNDNPGEDYILMNDLDFTNYTKEGTDSSVIMTAFTGRIDGNGHTIKNLNGYALFANFNGTVINLNIQNFTNIKTGESVAAFAVNTSGAILQNMNFDNITLEGTHRVAPVSAFDNANSTFEHISVKGVNVKGTGVYVSTFIGRKYGGIIKNVYVEGSLECMTTENGGLVGALQKGGTIENVITNVIVNKSSSTDSRSLNAGFIGNIYTESAVTIKNSISIGNMLSYDATHLPYKFTGASTATIAATITNCYEYSEATGKSNLIDNNLKSATRANIYSQAFYKSTLQFDESVWDLSTITSKGYPVLK